MRYNSSLGRATTDLKLWSSYKEYKFVSGCKVRAYGFNDFVMLLMGPHK